MDFNIQRFDENSEYLSLLETYNCMNTLVSQVFQQMTQSAKPT